MTHIRKNVRSTKIKMEDEPKPEKVNSTINLDNDDDFNPITENTPICTNHVYTAVVEVSGNISTNLTGKFPVT